MTSNPQTSVYAMCKNVVDELYDFDVFSIWNQLLQQNILNDGFKCII